MNNYGLLIKKQKEGVNVVVAHTKNPIYVNNEKYDAIVNLNEWF